MTLSTARLRRAPCRPPHAEDALYQKHHCSAEEARRIAEILTHASADILIK